MKTHIEKSDPFTPIFTLDRDNLTINPLHDSEDRPLPTNVQLPELRPGTDYEVTIIDGVAVATPLEGLPAHSIGGFHVGLDGKIVPGSLWDVCFRPKARDPRGMVLVAGAFWADIYLLNTDPQTGTSRANQPIARNITWWDAVNTLAEHGKQPLSMAEFSLATSGVDEGKRAGDRPETTNHIAGLKSAAGLEQATGCMWVWGRDFDPNGYAIVLGGYWGSPVAGPRRFSGADPGGAWNSLGARGRCDHLILG